MSNKYLQHLDNASGVSRHVSKVVGIFGDDPSKKTALVPVKKTWRDQLAELRNNAAADVEDNYLTGAVGGAAGYYLWKKHPVLGAFAGFSLGRNVPAMLAHPSDRRLALCNLAVVGSAVAASLYAPKHPKLAFAGGGLAAYIALMLTGVRR